MAQNIKQGQAEYVALAVFGILIIGAIISCFVNMPIWVKFANIVISVSAFYAMYKTNTKGSFSEVLMSVIWIVAAGVMSWLTFVNHVA